MLRGVDIHKSLMIGAVGRVLRKVTAGSGITTNEGFSGIYDFNRNESASQVPWQIPSKPWVWNVDHVPRMFGLGTRLQLGRLRRLGE